MATTSICISIKSKKHPDLKCSLPATKGEFCCRHWKSKIVWQSKTPVPVPKPFNKKQKAALGILKTSFLPRFRLYLRRAHGPAFFVPDLAHNDRDLYSLEPLSSIPSVYRFSFADDEKRLWMFDLRFLLNMLQYGNQISNPYTQVNLKEPLLQKLQKRSEHLTRRKIPVLYTEPEGLTGQQIWNQKVLDVFLKLQSLGFGANVLWFETLSVRGHELFYRRLYNLWHFHLHLTEEDRDRIVPGHNAGRNPLFKWNPDHLDGRASDIKWWRKQTLQLMNAFLSRGQDRDTQGCGALYILTALAQTHPRAAEAFPWLAGEA